MAAAVPVAPAAAVNIPVAEPQHQHQHAANINPTAPPGQPHGLPELCASFAAARQDDVASMAAALFDLQAVRLDGLDREAVMRFTAAWMRLGPQWAFEQQTHFSFMRSALEEGPTSVSLLASSCAEDLEALLAG